MVSKLYICMLYFNIKLYKTEFQTHGTNSINNIKPRCDHSVLPRFCLIMMLKCTSVSLMGCTFDSHGLDLACELPIGEPNYIY